MINQNDQAELCNEFCSSRASSKAKNVHFLFEVAKKGIEGYFWKTDCIYSSSSVRKILTFRTSLKCHL